MQTPEDRPPSRTEPSPRTEISSIARAPRLIPPEEDGDRRVWQEFRKHSRTFSFAARFLPRAVRLPVATLYLYCRTVDTIADERPAAVGYEGALGELYAAREALARTLAGDPPEGVLWPRLARVHERFGLSETALYELIEGAEWDLTGKTVETYADLVRYCDLVGGCVGAMMLPFLAKDPADAPRLDAPARELGIAMQLTNITRDVGEDLIALERCYLPAEWLSEAGLSPIRLLAEGPTPAYAQLLERVMHDAEARYESAEPALDELTRPARLGIRTALRTYREILNEVRARGYDNLGQRAYTTLGRKVRLVVRDGYAARSERLRQGSAAILQAA
jgi:phytoene synthase